MKATARVRFDNGAEMILNEDGSVVGTNERCRGAVTVDRQGRTIDTHFTIEVTSKPETIVWRYRDGKQKTFLYNGSGQRLEGLYTVEKIGVSVENSD